MGAPYAPFGTPACIYLGITNKAIASLRAGSHSDADPQMKGNEEFKSITPSSQTNGLRDMTPERRILKNWNIIKIFTSLPRSQNPDPGSIQDSFLHIASLGFHIR